jgi:transposase
MLPVSNDTLLRVVRQRGTPSFTPPSVVGIDDWAWRRNQRYGTIICDLERRKTITLPPDREPATAQAWFSGQPQINIVARDRGGGYALAAATALPSAIQVADRWHLMENASRAFLDAVRKSMREIRAAIGTTTINPRLLTAAERIQFEGYLRREETNAAILALAQGWTSIREIVRQTGHSRGLVRNVLRGRRSDVFRTRESSLEAHLQWLDAQWAAGHHNAAELWRRLKKEGFRGSLRVVTEWATRRRQAEKANIQNLQRIPSSRTIARLMTISRDTLSKSETVTVAAIEDSVPLLVEAREVIAEFHAMIRKKSRVDLGTWLERARATLVESFANGITNDSAAVSAAITTGWSNGQAARGACVGVKAGVVRIARPRNGADPGDPETVALTYVEVCEINPPKGYTPIIWRLLTTLPVCGAADEFAAATDIVRLYRLRWRIEQVFRSMKSDGLRRNPSPGNLTPVQAGGHCADRRGAYHSTC